MYCYEPAGFIASRKKWVHLWCMKQRHDEPQFKFRIPSELKEALELAAQTNNRTLTSEIIHRLEKSFSDNHEPWIAHTRKDALEFQLFQAEAKLKWLSQKWDERLATKKPLGNLEAIMYESDISALEDSILFLKNKISEIDSAT